MPAPGPAAADQLQHGGQPLPPSLQLGHLQAAALCPAATAGCLAPAVHFLAETALHAAGNALCPAAAALRPAETAAESGPQHGRLQGALLAGAAADLASVAALQPARQRGVFSDRPREDWHAARALCHAMRCAPQACCWPCTQQAASDRRMLTLMWLQ